MNSMTGFGNAELTTDTGLEIRIDARSYNKKHLDVRVQLPLGFAGLEGALSKVVSKFISRGSVFLKVDVKPVGRAVSATFKINKELAAAYKREIEKLKRKLDLSGEVDVNNILTLPGVVVEETPDSLANEDDFSAVAESAMRSLSAMRAAEGGELKRDLAERLKKLSALVDRLEPLAESIPAAQKKRLLNNLKSSGFDLSFDDDRVLKEVVVFSDRHDVSEELTRLKSHIARFHEMLELSEPVGRSMEFLTQELQREMNTLGTKAAHCDTTPLVVEFKTELEKIREQVQNVE
jgi:uncharacterized protein (TIGR00255 family)